MICPAMGATGPCPWLEMQQRRQRLRGWLASGLAVALSLSGVTLLAVSAAPAPEPFVLAMAPAPMPALMAMPLPVAEPLIQPEMLESPESPGETADLLPQLPPEVAPAEPPAAPDLAAPQSEAAPEVMAEAPPPKPKPKPEAKPKPEKTAKSEPKPEKRAKKSEAQAASQSSAPAAQAASNVSPKAWAASVAKQIRKTKKQKAQGRGVVQVGFTVGADGSLQGVQVLQSSGDAAVDALGLDHIRRAAPFAPPPEGAARQMAFAFEVR